MTSDGRAVDLPLAKATCQRCGAARTTTAIPDAFWTSHYTEDYTLAGRGGAAEPAWFGPDGMVPRSALAAEWIAASLSAAPALRPRSILEVGCGDGAVLARLKAVFPNAALHGVEPNAHATSLARARGLDVRQASYDAVAGQFDLVYSIAVIEHVVSPRHFLTALRALLKPAGRLIVIHPCQDRPSNDIFMLDHLHHFHSQHLLRLAKNVGLAVEAANLGTRMFVNFALARLVPARCEIPAPAAWPSMRALKEAIASWRHIFAAVDDWLARWDNRPIIVWGIGENFDLLRAYCQLGKQPICLGIDERAQARGQDFPIRSAAVVRDGELRATPVLLTFRPSKAIEGRLTGAGAEWFCPLPSDNHEKQQ